MRALPLAVVALALLAGTAGYITHRALNPPPPPPLLDVAAAGPATLAADADPDDPRTWPLATPQGGTRRLDEVPGEVVVVNFWATWCPPCLREIPAFMALQQTYAADGLQFVGVALDQLSAVAPFIAEHALNYPVLLGEEAVIRMMGHYGNDIGGLPFTVVLRGGDVVYTHRGEWTEADAESRLRGFLKGH